jgi:hypothetical protein
VRTTLDIHDDVLQAAKDRARHQGKSTGEVISELARAALTGLPDAASRQPPKKVQGFRPFAKRGGVVTNELIDKLREDDAY